uniref:non-specific serine/threonine protein kinase n=1 Tax=Setaria viridis TaxID=4556 RepID=A0A4U6W7P3_SETVI|nr:hypothetical protein SEVIR_1G050100v2 [Setaria viridis]
MAPKRHAASRRLSPLDGPPSPPSLRDRLVSPHHCLPAFIFMCPPGGVKVKLGVEMERKRGLSSATSRAGAPGEPITSQIWSRSAFAGSSDIENLYDLRDAVAKSKDSLSDWFGTETCPCNWRGITCEGDTVVAINLSSVRLHIPFPLCITAFRSLGMLNLSGCDLSGQIPEALGNLQQLQYLDLSSNQLAGPIPFSLYDLKTLKEIVLDRNSVSGQLSPAIGQLQNLTKLSISRNNISGELPPELGSLKNLEVLDLQLNRFNGSIPEAFGNLTRLFYLDASRNKLTGSIFPGISALLNLLTIDFSSNSLVGPIPNEITHLKMLERLALGFNHFTGGIPKEIGELPGKLFESSTFLELSLDNNNLTGHIPESIGKLHSLQRLRMGSNHLEGPIPLAVGALENLTEISLDGNRLSGSIPQELFNCRNLVKLNLSSNSLMGPIPRSISQLTSVTGLVLSHNQLSGSIPAEICGGFTNPTHPESEYVQHHGFLDLSYNLLSGRIPPAIKNCVILEELLLQGNLLNGSIPAEVAELKNITKIDLSFNALVGPMLPWSAPLLKLQGLFLSNNHLSGNIPAEIGRILPNIAVLNLSGICAADSINRRGSHTPHVILTVVAICVAVTVVIVVLLVFFLRWKLLRNNRSLPLVPTTASQSSATTEPSSMEPPSINLATFEHALLRFTLEDILKATNNFSNVHIIGQGGFGTVYKAALPEGRRVAIKRLYGSHQFLGDRQFLAEMETIGKVKHRNLVPLLGYCARGDERFLIYEHMSHGSLETWLRDRANAPKAIGWPDRLRICIGSAHGLMFLHHGFVPRIIHRDMKSSNILLDENMEPRISDFGLARIISAYDTHVSTNVAGTLGYIPPEYAMTMKCTAKGDVFSFGVVMLEVLTGRPPTGQEVEEGGGNIIDWVRWMIAQGREGELFDPSLPVSGLWREQMVRVLAIALDCTADEPRNRPTMPDVVKGLKIAELMESEPHDLPGRVAQP